MARRKPAKPTKLFKELERAVSEMYSLARQIDELPDDFDFTQENLMTLDDVRIASSSILANAEAAIETFQGDRNAKA